MIYTEDLINSIYEDIAKQRPYGLINKAYASQYPSRVTDTPPAYPKIKNDFDLKYFWDIGYKIYLNKPISSKQYSLLVKCLRGYKHLMLDLGFDSTQLDYWFNYTPTKLNTYESKEIKREVKYLGDNFIAFRFLVIPELIDVFKSLRSTNKFYFREENIYVVECNPTSIKALYTIISKYKFSFDADLENYLYFVENNKDIVYFDINEEEIKYPSSDIIDNLMLLYNVSN